MTYDLFLELVRLQKKSNISEDIFRRIIKKSREKGEEKEVHMLRRIFGGNFNNEVLEVFTDIYEAGVCSIKRIDEYSPYLEMVLASTPEIKKIADYILKLEIGFSLYGRYPLDTELQLYFASREFLNLSMVELRLKKDIYTMLYRIDTENEKLALHFYKGDSLAKSVLEDYSIHIGKRKALLSLLDDRELFLNDDYGQNVYSYLIYWGYNISKAFYLLEKNKDIRGNILCQKFIMNEINSRLLYLAYLAFSSKDLDNACLEELLSLKSFNDKKNYLENLIDKNYQEKIDKKNKKILGKVLKENFDSFLDDDISIEEFENMASLLRKKEFTNLRVDF